MKVPLLVLLAVLGCAKADPMPPSFPGPGDGAVTVPPPKDAPPAQGVACGSVTCGAGMVCCNASCGICTPPGNACIQIACEPKADAGTTGGACQTADDCRLFDDYCTGCDCRALAKSDPDPKCSGPGVRCLRQPCADKMVACVKGRCAVADKPRR